jgi:hypothetical protein
LKKLTKYAPHLALAGIIAAAMVGLSLYKPEPHDPTLRPRTTAEFAKTSVMIRMLNKLSGGTGVILNSTPTGSVILTNKHVCEVIHNGGLVTTTDGRDYDVKKYKEYPKHDLCLVSVKEDLGVITAVAEKAPVLYSRAKISGHPRLLPHVLAEGDFSDYEVIEVLIGMKPCTGAPGEDMMSCFFYGGMPIVKKYESELVTALIMPGSSGSAVFNASGEIENLVFAGAGQGLSYAFTVPHKYVSDFVKNEAKYKWKKSVKLPMFQVNTELMKKIRITCSNKTFYSEYCPW